MKIRPFKAEDIPEALLIENASFTCPWHESSMRMLLEDHIFAIKAVNEEERMCGFAALMRAADTGEVINIAVDPGSRRRGLGRQLLDCLLKHAKEEELAFVTLEVRESNEPARALYDSFGFVRVGTLKNYYTDPREDAWILLLTLEKEKPEDSNDSGT